MEFVDDVLEVPGLEDAEHEEEEDEAEGVPVEACLPWRYLALHLVLLRHSALLLCGGLMVGGG